MQNFGAKNVLIKGGHFFDSETDDPNAEQSNEIKNARDFLFAGDELTVFETEYIQTTSTHGTGCTLAAAIAANLATGNDLTKAVQIAKNFVLEAIRAAPPIGKGNSSINRLIKFF